MLSEGNRDKIETSRHIDLLDSDLPRFQMERRRRNRKQKDEYEEEPPADQPSKSSSGSPFASRGPLPA